MRGKPGFNFAEFDKAEMFLLSKGFVPISPATMDRLFDGWNPHPPEDLLVTSDLKARCMRRDLIAILDLRPENGDVIYVLDGWKDSAGAKVEVALAQFLGLPIVLQYQWGLAPVGGG